MIEHLNCIIDWSRLTEQEQKKLKQLLAIATPYEPPKKDTFEHEIYKLMTEQ